MATTVRVATIVSMTNELKNFKNELMLSITTGSQLPKTNSEIILKKYINVATKELNVYMPKKTANKIAKNTLTSIMLDSITE